ncbi:hypothetical protein [Staphylococcus shinii]|nr:hypothetical protein [Staphylococcus shinii]MBO3066340.1 hypothetical protein [Staphylococcus shinii]MDW8565481.1 hypothetical protein [Staphylococcus shinii]QRA17530.1 hypothetical protein JMB28_04765 [Staphylococcus shinii]
MLIIALASHYIGLIIRKVSTLIFKKALGYPKASHLDILCKGIQPL